MLNTGFSDQTVACILKMCYKCYHMTSRLRLLITSSLKIDNSIQGYEMLITL